MTFAISREPLQLDELIAAVRGDDCGAVVTFCGVVRADGDGGRIVEALEYEVYIEGALAELRAIGEEVALAFAGARVAIAHRVGRCALGEPSVAIAAAAPHRALAFDACEYAIDELKLRAPIWKKERYRDGAASWRPNAGS